MKQPKAIAVERLVEWPDNPRMITPTRLQQLKTSIEAEPSMLWARPLVAIENGTVIMGNMRLRAVRELGWETVPVVFVQMDEAEATVWALRDNASYGEWNEAMLSEWAYTLAEKGVDLEAVGLETDQARALLESAGVSIGGDLEEHEAPTDVRIVFGRYRTDIPVEEFDRWKDQIIEKVGYDNVRDEIIKRLGV